MTDMGVGVDKTRRDEATRGIENFAGFAARVLGAGPDVTDPAVENRDLHPFENFSGVDVDEFSAADNEIGFDLPERAADKASKLLLDTSS